MVKKFNAIYKTNKTNKTNKTKKIISNNNNNIVDTTDNNKIITTINTFNQEVKDEILMEINELKTTIIEAINKTTALIKYFMETYHYETKTIKLKDKFKQKSSAYWLNGKTPIGIYCWTNI